MKVKLSELPVRAIAKILSYQDDNIACRMLAMGLLPDSEVSVVRLSPLGDALYIRFENTLAAIRKIEAQHILVSMEAH